MLDRASSQTRWGGETFTDAIRDPLTQLGCWEPFQRAGHVVGYERQTAWGGQPRVEDSLFRPGSQLWHVDRDRFDADLRRRLVECGVKFNSYCKLQAISLENEHWNVMLDRGWRVRARYLVDASGRPRTLGRRLGARIESHDRLVGFTTRVGAGEAAADIRSMLIEATPFGWWYAAPTPAGHVLAMFTDADLGPHRQLHGFRPVAANSVFTDTEGCEGWLAVGDACASHDPLCGWGVHRALTNGLLAGDAIASLLATGNSAPVTAYRRHCRQQYQRYLLGLTYQYSREQRWTTAAFWRRRHHSTHP
jgi:flavin-dependent dehydrogenase